MLGFNGASEEPTVSFYRRTTATVWLDNVACQGSEDNILLCQGRDLGHHNCSNSQVVGTNCYPAAPSPAIRLVNSARPWMGRVEVWMNKTWGTVCYNNFDTNDARVVCRMLGFMGDQPVVYDSAHFGQGSGAIWMDNVRCNGSEQTIFQCGHNGLGVHSCGHSGDVGIDCQPNAPLLPVRLVNGMQPWEGRLEVWNAGSWGTVCTDSFDVMDARVVCISLGYTSFQPGIFNSSQFGPGTGNIWLDDLHCLGTEQNVFLCSHNGLGITNCGHSQDAGVSCQTLAPHPIVRLSNGSFPWEGRIEVWNDGSWGTVCSYNFDANDARVVCRMLGFNSASVEPTVSFYRRTTATVWLNNVACQGSEDNILLCQGRDLGHHNCSNSQVVGTNCYPAAPSAIVRLANGIYPWVGRVEVWNQGTWGTVCENGFDQVDASVVCKDLGYHGDSQVVNGSNYYGEAVGSIWLDNVSCDGTEVSILQCPYRFPGIPECNHSHDVCVNCQPSAPSPPVRLVNGSRPGAGRLEMWNNGTWGTICYDSFDTYDAHVVCKMLGFMGDQPIVYSSAHFGQGLGSIWQETFRCTGSEQTIFQCPHNDEIGVRLCERSNDVVIDCQPNTPLLRTRLVNGTHPWEGRLEVWNAGSWGTVCTDSFDVLDARVVCISLGYTNIHPGALNSSHYGQGTGAIWLDDLECLGTERDIFLCPHNGLGIINCSHNQDAGVNCQTLAPSPAVRLSNGSFPWEGRIEVWNDGSWGSVCSYNFDTNDARVVCRMLGFNSIIEGPTISYYNQIPEKTWLDNVACQGTEDNIFLCQHGDLGINNCSNFQVVGTNCYPSAPSTIVRLANGMYPWVGRVEVWNKGAWGTVCENGFDQVDASVVCKDLGYHGDSPVVNGSKYYGEGVGPIWLDNVACEGTEASILQCPYRFPGIPQCNHSHDVGVNCQPDAPLLPVRLVNGMQPWEGRLEVWNAGSWGTVCTDSFDVRDAKVVCKSLGYTNIHPGVLNSSHFGQGTGTIWFDDLQCLGTERNIFLCPHNALGITNCHHNQDAGVNCQTLAPSPAVRLSNGSFPWEGRIEVWNDGSWGSVCSYNFDANDARVVCRMLGFNSISEAPTVPYYTQTRGKIWLDNVRCRGSEGSILLCQRRDLGINNCRNSQVAGTNCYPSAPSSVVRLVGGLNPWVGRVEVWNQGTWGTVCKNNFDQVDASVVCKDLGYTGNIPEVNGSDHYGEGVGTVWLGNVSCEGTEANILKCPYRPPEIHKCNHSQDVGVNCQPSAPSTPVRLVNGSRACEGRVEVWNNGSWGTVCNDNFDVNDATVLCMMLNYTGEQPLVKTGLNFGQGNGPIWLEDMDCDGHEQSIFLCRHGQLGVTNCQHSKDVGIDCCMKEVAVASEQSDTTDQSMYIGIGIGAVIIVIIVVAIIVFRKRQISETMEAANANVNNHTGRQSTKLKVPIQEFQEGNSSRQVERRPDESEIINGMSNNEFKIQLTIEQTESDNENESSF